MFCAWCRREFERRVFWQLYCSDRCRVAWHCEMTRRGRELVRRERAAVDPPRGPAVGETGERAA